MSKEGNRGVIQKRMTAETTLDSSASPNPSLPHCSVRNDKAYICLPDVGLKT